MRRHRLVGTRNEHALPMQGMVYLRNGQEQRSHEVWDHSAVHVEAFRQG